MLLVHPGGPYWRNRDDEVWSIPKGEIGTLEDPEQAARREFAEELGPAAKIRTLQPWERSASAAASASSPSAERPTSILHCCPVEWPPKSGKLLAFPEVDRAEWCDLGLRPNQPC